MVKWGVGWSEVELESCDEKYDELLAYWSGEDTREWRLNGMFLFKLDQKKYSSCGVSSVELGNMLVFGCSLVAFLILCWVFFLIDHFILWINKECLKEVGGGGEFLVMVLGFGEVGWWFYCCSFMYYDLNIFV